MSKDGSRHIDSTTKRQTRCSGLIELPLFTNIQEHIRTNTMCQTSVTKTRLHFFPNHRPTGCTRYKIYRDSNLPTLLNQHTYLQALSREILKEKNKTKQNRATLARAAQLLK